MNKKVSTISKISQKIIIEIEEFINSDLFEGGVIGFLLVNQKIEDTILTLTDSEILKIIIENNEFLNVEIDNEFFEDEYLFKDKDTIVLTDLVKSHLKPYILAQVMEHLSSKGIYDKNKEGTILIKYK